MKKKGDNPGKVQFIANEKEENISSKRFAESKKLYVPLQSASVKKQLGQKIERMKGE